MSRKKFSSLYSTHLSASETFAWYSYILHSLCDYIFILQTHHAGKKFEGPTQLLDILLIVYVLIFK